MPIVLEPADLEFIEQIAARPTKPTLRQRAQAILRLSQGEDPERVAQIVGIPKLEVLSLEQEFQTQGVKLFQGHEGSLWVKKTEGLRGIEKTAGVCGGSARVAGTRIPVWLLVELRQQGASEAEILLDYPGLAAEDLVNAWAYANAHSEEIAAEILENEVA